MNLSVSSSAVETFLANVKTFHVPEKVASETSGYSKFYLPFLYGKLAPSVQKPGTGNVACL